MGVLVLVDPVAGTTTDATQQASNNAALKAIINGGIDATNFAAGKIFDPTKLQQDGAIDKQALLWDNANSRWAPAGAYTAFTPVWTGGGAAIGNGTLSGRYLQIGKFVHYFGQIIFGTTTNPGGGAGYGISMPVNIQNGFVGSSARMTGVIELFHQATNSSMFAWADNAGSVSAFTIVYPATYGGTRVAAGGAAPWAWGTSDFIAWNMLYEAA